jgi:chaperonin GroEL (HSP60 family)
MSRVKHWRRVVVNKLRGTLKVAGVKGPGFGDRRKAMLRGHRVAHRRQRMTEDLGIKLENVSSKDLGAPRSRQSTRTTRRSSRAPARQDDRGR